MSMEKVAHDQLRTALWYRMYQLTGIWHGVKIAQSAEPYMRLKISQLYTALAPWSIIAFRYQYPFFTALETILGALFTGVLVMNQLQAHSIQDLLYSVLYSRTSELALRSPAHTGMIALDAHSDTRSTHTFPSSLRASQLPCDASLISTPEDAISQDLDSSARQKLLSFNDVCFNMEDPGVGHSMTLQLEDCGVYSSPGGFNSGGAVNLLSNDALEFAMDITEQIALLSDAPGPIPTDMPLLFVRLTQQTLSDLHSWLQTCYDWDEDISRLLAPNLSAEVLAWDIKGYPTRVESLAGSPLLPVSDAQDRLLVNAVREFNAPVLVDALIDIRKSVPVREVGDTHAGSKPRRRLEPRTTLSITIYPNDELSSIEIIALPEASARLRRSRLAPKTDISIVVVPDQNFASIEVISTPVVTAPPPPPLVEPATPSKYLKGEIELDIGMASYQTWNGGKKTSILAGLLSLGALLSPLPRSPFGPLAAGLMDVRSPPPPKASILSPWLDVVHFHGLEPVQSPWVADHTEVGAFPDFPESPFVF